MPHLDEGALQALLDDELHPDEREALRAHLAGCAACGAEMRSLRGASETLSGALKMLDVAPRTEQARWRLEGRRRAPRSAAVLRRAALLVVGSAAVLSATVPGSPVRAWLTGGGNGAGVETAAETPVDAPVAMAGREAADAQSGVSVAATGGPVRVVLRDAAAGVTVRVREHGGDRVGVWAEGGAASAAFETAPDRVEMRGGGEGEVRVEVPRSVRSFALEVNGRVVLQREGERFRLADPTADTAGAEVRIEVRP